eukprot:gene8130-7490_t
MSGATDAIVLVALGVVLVAVCGATFVVGHLCVRGRRGNPAGQPPPRASNHSPGTRMAAHRDLQMARRVALLASRVEKMGADMAQSSVPQRPVSPLAMPVMPVLPPGFTQQ